MRALLATGILVAALLAGSAAGAPTGFRAQISRLDAAQRERMTRAGRALVDGRGADRVAACFVEGLG